MNILFARGSGRNNKCSKKGKDGEGVRQLGDQKEVGKGFRVGVILVSIRLKQRMERGV